mgnify:CR=1 FL=1
MTTNINASSLKTNVETRDLEVFDNTSEFAVKINESKARLIYNRYFKATSGGVVLSFLGTFLSCLTTLLTATFNDIWGIAGSSAVLTAIFVIIAGVFGLLTLIWTVKWIHSLIRLNETSFIDELKGDSKGSSASP